MAVAEVGCVLDSILARSKLVAASLILTLPLVTLPIAAQSSSANPELQRATENLRAADEEWRREEAAYRAALKGGTLKGATQSEYAEFVAGLRVRLLEQCEVVRALGGNEPLRGFECILLGVRQRTVVIPDSRSVLTDEEKQAALSARLGELEGKIDETLLKRQQEIKSAAASSSSASGGTSGSAGGGASAAGGVSGNAGSSGQARQSGALGSGTPSASGQPGSTGAAIPRGSNPTGAPPPPSAGGPTDNRRAAPQARSDGGVDDDVVARQLREAAEREADPTLKEKLWAEYRKYKEAKR